MWILFYSCREGWCFSVSGFSVGWTQTAVGQTSIPFVWVLFVCLFFTFNLHMHDSEVSSEFEYCVYTEYGASSLWLPPLWDFLPCFLAAVIVLNFVLCFFRLLKTGFFSRVLAVLYGATNCPSSFFWVSVSLADLPSLVHSLVPLGICFYNFTLSLSLLFTGNLIQ